MTREIRESVALIMAITIAVFVLASLVVLFVLALRGVGLPDVWTSLFGLVVAIMSGLSGWFVGKTQTETEKAPPL